MKRKNKEKIIKKTIDIIENRFKNKYLCDFEIDKNDIIDQVLGEKVRSVKETCKPIEYKIVTGDIYQGTKYVLDTSENGYLIIRKVK